MKDNKYFVPIKGGLKKANKYESYEAFLHRKIKNIQANEGTHPRTKFRLQAFKIQQAISHHTSQISALNDVCEKIKHDLENYGKLYNTTNSYMVVITCNQIAFKRLKIFKTRESAQQEIEALTSVQVDFPVMFQVVNKRIVECEYEYLLLEDKEHVLGPSKDVVLKRDELGVIHQCDTNSENWKAIYAKPCLIEESFDILLPQGNKIKSVSFKNIFQDYINDGNKNLLRRIFVLDNKVLIDLDDERGLICIPCKNVEDSVRFYNLLQEWAQDKKIKSIIYMGFLSPHLKKEYTDRLVKNLACPRSVIAKKTYISSV